MKSFLSKIFIVVLSLLIFSCGSSPEAQKVGDAAGTGAALGALASVVFGSGNILYDAADGAVMGAAAGAAVGVISNSMNKDEAPRTEPEVAYEDEMVKSFGKDNVESYYALRNREHARALALADAGELSKDANHRLAAVWLKAMIAVDKKDSPAAEKAFDRLITLDPDIDTRQQASVETDKVVLDMRNERRTLSL
jgi:hypothetical protein